MPAKPGFMLRLMTKTVLALSASMIGMPKIGLRLVVPGGRIDHVVGPDDQRHVGLRHLGIDLVHLDQLIVGDLGLGQQHVHVAGHAAGHRVDGELHLHAALGQRVVQFADAVLGLGHGHAVAGHDDHGPGGVHDLRRVFGRGALDRALLGAARPAT